MQKIQIIITLTPNPDNFDKAEQSPDDMAQWFAGTIVASGEFEDIRKDDPAAQITYKILDASDSVE